VGSIKDVAVGLECRGTPCSRLLALQAVMTAARGTVTGIGEESNARTRRDTGCWPSDSQRGARSIWRGQCVRGSALLEEATRSSPSPKSFLSCFVLLNCVNLFPPLVHQGKQQRILTRCSSTIMESATEVRSATLSPACFVSAFVALQEIPQSTNTVTKRGNTRPSQLLSKPQIELKRYAIIRG
jgi:hypothetical protein